jgi:hypothetical protein
MDHVVGGRSRRGHPGAGEEAVAAGRSLEQVKAERPAREWEDRFPHSFVTSDHVVEEAYRAATAAR